MNILICDDHKIVRDGLKQILKLVGQNINIFEASNGKEVYANLYKTINIIVLDISLGNESGLEILKNVKQKSPQTQVIILSMHPQEQYAVRAIKYGASAYLTKDTASEELINAVREVAKGKRYISSSLANKLADNIFLKNTKQHDELSEREFEIMIKLATGMSITNISKELFISPKTVSTYKTRLMEKMKMTSNVDIVKYCIENKLI